LQLSFGVRKHLRIHDRRMTSQELIKLLSGPLGAFAAAWMGAHLGFRKTRKERALDRVV
jgi:hypothetical protein